MSTNLHKIAREIAISKRDSSESNLLEYILYGRDCLSELNTKGFIPIQSVALDIDTGSHSAKLPEDYVKYISVGICICNKIIELDYDETLCTREPVENYCTPCDKHESNYTFKAYKLTLNQVPSIVFKYTTVLSNPNGQSVTLQGYGDAGNSIIIQSLTIPVAQTDGDYSIVVVSDYDADAPEIDTMCEEKTLEAHCKCLCAGAIPNSFTSYYNWNGISYRGDYLDAIPTFPAYTPTGTYKIKNGRVYLNSVCGFYADKIILKYKSSGVSETGQTEVPALLKPTIKAYIQWQLELNNSTSLGLTEAKRLEYKRQAGLLTSQEVLKGVLDMLKAEMMHVYTGNLGR